MSDATDRLRAIADPSGAYLFIEDWSDPGRYMAAPNPDDPLEVEWTLRYSQPSREQALVAASYIAAYKQLVGDTQDSRRRKVSGIRSALARFREVAGE